MNNNRPLKHIKNVEKKKMGRPTVMTQQVQKRVCQLVAEGKSIRRIARMANMPARSTIIRHINIDPDFENQYRRARAQAGDFFADRVVEVADDTLEGKHDPNAARVAIAAYQWTAGKLNPKEYGDHQQPSVTVNIDMTEHAPDWIRERVGKASGPPTIDASAEVVADEHSEQPANTAPTLLSNIASAASEEVEPEGQ